MFGTERTPPPPLLAIGGSQGGLAAAVELLGALPRALPAAIVLLLHRPASRGDVLVKIIEKRTALAARGVRSADRLQAGTVHVAPGGCELRVLQDGVLDVREAPGSSSRHGVDLLLTSAAASLGPRTLAIVLSGRLADGAAGAIAVKAAGGRVLVQDPASAECAGMPAAALATGCVDYALPPPTLAAAATALLMARGADQLFRVRQNAAAAAVYS